MTIDRPLTPIKLCEPQSAQPIPTVDNTTITVYTRRNIQRFSTELGNDFEDRKKYLTALCDRQFPYLNQENSYLQS